jgi:hypothetical protein
MEFPAGISRVTGCVAQTRVNTASVRSELNSSSDLQFERQRNTNQICYLYQRLKTFFSVDIVLNYG